ncbi:macrophage mannose receptor 1-like isoform X2 [Sycon ciliatum]|uniref:macrophage mannose receptor 1-like isoform X2 n=1 Tax=Sycon ciliatum TaxID=27933 RepID=UPI0031F6DE23
MKAGQVVVLLLLWPAVLGLVDGAQAQDVNDVPSITDPNPTVPPSSSPAWHQCGNRSYMYPENVRKNLSMAVEHCRVYAEGGQIATPRNLVEQGCMNNSSLDTLWLGVYRVGGAWLDLKTKTEITAAFWGEHEPSGGDCATMRYDSNDGYKWDSTEACGQKIGFVCERQGGVPTPKPTITAAGPQPIWSQCTNASSAYAYIRARKTFVDAAHYCREQFSGATLAAPGNDFEQNCVTRLRPDTTTWLGFHNVAGVFMDFETGAAMTYRNWATGEPNGAMCVTMYHHRDDVRGKWDDTECTVRHHFICQRSKGGQPNTTDLKAWKACANTSYEYQYQGNMKKNFLEAATYCREHTGGQLAMPQNQAQQNCVFNSKPLTTIWLGINKVGHDWLEFEARTHLKYHNWAAHRHTGGHCGAMPYDFKPDVAHRWNLKRCDSLSRIVCQRKGHQASTTTVTPTTAANEGQTALTRRVGHRCANVSYEYYMYSRRTEMTFAKAANYCRTELTGGQIATPMNSEELNCLFEAKEEYTPYAVWLGFHKVGREFIDFETKTILNYSNWGHNEGRPDSHEKCVSLKQDGDKRKWRDVGCSITEHVLCQRAVANKTDLAAWKGCANTSYEYQYQGNMKKNFLEAATYCREHTGGQLAMPQSQAQQDCVFNSKPLTTIWLGFFRVGHQWLEFDGNFKLSFSNWAAHRPDGGSCGAMWYDIDQSQPQGQQWDDVNCAKPLMFVCQRKVTGNSSTTATVAPATTSSGPVKPEILWSECANSSYEYLFTSQHREKTFADAADLCMKYGGGRIAAPMNAIELNCIHNVKRTPWEMWLGFLRINGRLLDFATKRDVTYTNWPPNTQPHGHGCVRMSTAGHWGIVSCSNSEHVMCQRAATNRSELPAWSKCGNKSYLFQAHLRKNFAEAAIHCRTHYEGAKIAMPRTEAEHGCLYRSKPLTTIWLGIYRVGDTWLEFETKNRPGTFFWKQHEPRQGHCATMWYDADHANGKDWDATEACGDRVNFVCEKEVPPTNTSKEQTTVVTGPQPIWSGCRNASYEYVYVNATKTFVDAAEYCRNRFPGGQLATPANKTEENCASLSQSSATIWLGIHEVSGLFFNFVTGTRIDYANWEAGEPNNGKCVAMMPSSGATGQKWKATWCMQLHTFVCQRPANSSAPSSLSSQSPTQLPSASSESSLSSSSSSTSSPPSSASTPMSSSSSSTSSPPSSASPPMSSSSSSTSSPPSSASPPMSSSSSSTSSPPSSASPPMSSSSSSTSSPPSSASPPMSSSSSSTSSPPSSASTPMSSSSSSTSSQPSSTSPPMSSSSSSTSSQPSSTSPPMSSLSSPSALTPPMSLSSASPPMTSSSSSSPPLPSSSEPSSAGGIDITPTKDTTSPVTNSKKTATSAKTKFIVLGVVLVIIAGAILVLLLVAKSEWAKRLRASWKNIKRLDEVSLGDLSQASARP